MRKLRGFKLRRPLIKITRWIFRKPGSQLLKKSSCNSKPISKLLKWGRTLSKKTKSLSFFIKPGSGYMPLGQEPVEEKKHAVSVPKGHLAVYVGKNKDGDFHRVLVPVIYFNHPLFCELLREAEEEYGFAQQGGITIPCRFSEFESVKTKIDDDATATRCVGGGGRRMVVWRRH